MARTADNERNERCPLFKWLNFPSVNVGEEGIELCLHCPLDECVLDHKYTRKIDRNIMLAFCTRLKYVINLLTEEE